MTERAGQAFGRRCWKKGLGLEETMRLATKECGLDAIPEDPVNWPRFLHGVEEVWQDLQLEKDDEMAKLAEIADKYHQHTTDPAK